jgi:outer membrane protein assembly factor BamB
MFTCKKISNTLLLITIINLVACKQQLVEYSDNNCKKNAAFINKIGFNASKTYLTTADKKIMGLVMVDASTEKPKIYQDSSWKKAGWLAPIQIDMEGNVYVGPAPFINVLYNPLSNQNTVYKVAAQSGIMAPFVQLPFDSSIQTQNPFGIIGLAYLCEANMLYVSTVAGSNIQFEKGAVYQIDATTGKIKNKISAIDVLGMGISYSSGQRKLYFGKARNSDVYSIVLNEKGDFIGEPIFEFSLQGLGIRGDDKVRRIKSEKDGSLAVYGIEFNFNLVAPSEKLETIYKFVFNEEQKKWFFLL